MNVIIFLQMCDSNRTRLSPLAGTIGICDEPQLILRLPAENAIIWALPSCIGSLNLTSHLLTNAQNLFTSKGFQRVEDEETSSEIKNTLLISLYNSLSL